MSESPEKRGEKRYIKFDMRSKTKEVTAILSTNEEKEAVLSVLSPRLIELTSFETDGTFREGVLRHIKVLREVTKRLAVELGKDKIWTPREWLHLGIIDFVPEKILKKLATEELGYKPEFFEQILQKKARYFLNQKIKEKK